MLLAGITSVNQSDYMAGLSISRAVVFNHDGGLLLYLLIIIHEDSVHTQR